ncbi:S8 family peptidase [Cellulosilyticum sp. I15G10I2]|uniref:S8 family peptidase n=1 Tax=Cellulosilyticum sp. I15G10I2 TaxID=1892843 RepID=UPI00085CAB02|nr:S8 family peptidase [Cellulosilyticum sp. I15G10I2]
MFSNKLDPRLQLALRYQHLFTPGILEPFTVNGDPNRWEVIVEYVEEIQEMQLVLNIRIYYLNNSFAIVQINRDDINTLARYPNVVYISFPEIMSYINIALNQICATNIANPLGIYNLTGRGTLIAIIDTGINYTHPDFIREDLTSRIRYIWDQTIIGSPPEGFESGTEYTNEQINIALREPTREAQLAVVPSEDVIGHGTAMAGIAAGSGRGSNRQILGVAPECELIIVKIGREGGTSARPTDKDVMLGIKYVINKARAENKPVSVLLGVGYNLDAHDGDAILERYIDQMADVWRSNFVVGTGNQANKGSHASGTLNPNETQVVQFFIDSRQITYECSIWKHFVDVIEIVIESPRGEQTESLSLFTPNRAFVFGNTLLMVNYSLANIGGTRQEIFVWLQAEGAAIDPGVWTILIRGVDILEGDYNIWGSIIEDVDNQTRFLAEDPNITLTIPSTSRRITSVATFNPLSLQIAAFSGRGFTSLNQIKPDITAPGVNIMTTSIREGTLYEAVSGTSAAAAFVAGAYAILMEYGIAQLGEQYLYGESLKLYMLRNARRPVTQAPYPNTQWGYGILCIEAALNNMRDTLIFIAQG